MTRWIRFLIVLVPGLIAVAWLTLEVATRANRAWFERDAAARAELAAAGARATLGQHWAAGETGSIADVLQAIERDERIVGVTACRPDGTMLAATTRYPRELDCLVLAREQQRDGALGSRHWAWTRTLTVAGRPVHATVVWLDVDGAAGGFVAILEDFALLDRLDRQTRRIVLLGLVAVLAGAWIVMAVAMRLSRRNWIEEVRRLLNLYGASSRFHPALQDLRDLVRELAAEVQAESRADTWTSERLRQVLRTQLHGDAIVVLANREPYIHRRTDDGQIVVQHPASGLVTALEPVMRACSGVWIAHGSGSADRETADRSGRLRVPPGDETYVLRRVWLANEEEQGYYYGFANEGLWPLCHIAHIRPTFRREDWEQYRRVNARFADVVAQEAGVADPIVLVQDYHFALAPRLIRERLPAATVLTFWHIPWPNAERMGICPWRQEIVRGLLGSGILGFQTQLHCNNFLETVDRFLEARIDREQFATVHEGLTTLVRPYPISIEWPSRRTLETQSVPECRASVRLELGLGPDALLGVGVDRMDYTKGLEERLGAVEHLLHRYPEYRGRFTFVQIAAPSRSAIEAYQSVAARVERLAEGINEQFGTGSYRPVVLRRTHHEPAEVFRYYRAADVCYVSSLHDGMNMVAKEFVAARDDELGGLVLSSFTGASRELAEALIVNPYDLDEAADALATALAMPADEQRARMRAMRTVVGHFNVYRWAGRMLSDAAQLREQARLARRLSAWAPVEPGG